MSQTQNTEIADAKAWLTQQCHQAGVRRLLERGLEYVEALDRAGLSPEGASGDELYEFLSDAGATSARSNAFIPPTL